jgi:hypothetical protein
VTCRDPEKTVEDMLLTFGDSLSYLASSDDAEDGEDEDDDETEQGKLSEDDKPGWVIGTIIKTVQQWMERFRQKQMKRDDMTKPGWEDASDYICARDKMSGTSELWVPPIIQPQSNKDSLAHPQATFGELIESLDSVHGISQMQELTFQPRCSHIRLGSVKPQ